MTLPFYQVLPSAALLARLSPSGILVKSPRKSTPPLSRICTDIINQAPAIYLARSGPTFSEGNYFYEDIIPNKRLAKIEDCPMYPTNNFPVNLQTSLSKSTDNESNIKAPKVPVVIDKYGKPYVFDPTFAAFGYVSHLRQG